MTADEKVSEDLHKKFVTHYAQTITDAEALKKKILRGPVKNIWAINIANPTLAELPEEPFIAVDAKAAKLKKKEREVLAKIGKLVPLYTIPNPEFVYVIDQKNIEHKVAPKNLPKFLSIRGEYSESSFVPEKSRAYWTRYGKQPFSESGAIAMYLKTQKLVHQFAIKIISDRVFALQTRQDVPEGIVGLQAMVLITPEQGCVELPEEHFLMSK